MSPSFDNGGETHTFSELFYATTLEPSPPLTVLSEARDDRSSRIQPDAVSMPTKGAPSKYAKLLPKPLASVQVSPSWPTLPRKISTSGRKSDVSVTKGRRCRVRCCRLLDCSLPSHSQFGLHRVPKLDPERKVETNVQRRGRNVQVPIGFHPLPQPSPDPQPVILQGGVDGLPALPLDGLESPVFRELFHRFFTYQYERIMRLLQPPPASPAQMLEMADFKTKALEVALSAPIYCLHHIAAAHHQVVFNRNQQRPDRTTALLHGKIVKLLREKLDKFADTEIQEVVLVILTLVTFEIAYGHTQSILLHRKAVQHLIGKNGGFHNMTRVISIVLTLDRILSIFTCLPPLYATPPNQHIRKPPTVPKLYGGFMEEEIGSALLGRDLRDYCVDTCRAIELLEEAGWTFDPYDPPLRDSPNLPYFFFLRECTTNHFVRLNASMLDDSIPRCVLMAAKIIEYSVLMDGYIVTIPIEMANRIRRMIAAPSTNKTDWSNHQPILTWILFVVTCLHTPWDGYMWAMRSLKQQLELKYSRRWPVDWRQQELTNVRHFVWSDAKFHTEFMKTCNELTHTSSRTSNGSLDEVWAEIVEG